MSATGEKPAGATAVRPFRVEIPQAEVDELRRRIAATRWPEKETVDDGSQGTPLAKLQELVRYWGTDYDCRRFEARLNALPQFVTSLDGLDIHFIHVRSPYPDALPLIMTHGWPGSIVELLKTIGPLTDPTAHGGRAEDAFHLVLPSMPGFGFSEKPTSAGWNPDHIARAWAELVTRLGYTRYVSQGGDWGSVVAEAMGRQAPAGLLGIHVNLPATVPADVAAALAAGGPAPDGLSEDERATFDKLATGSKTGGRAYFAMLTARPQNMGYGMADSPAGLAAWMLVHGGFTEWTYEDDAERSPTKDEVLDDITLYWLTNTGTSAGRIYWENGGANPSSAAVQSTDEISLPVAITVFPGESYQAPRSWAERAYPNLTYFNKVDKGGHFAAWEEPELFATELRAAFRSLRQDPSNEVFSTVTPPKEVHMSATAPQAPGLTRTDIQEHDLSIPGRQVIQNRVDISPDAPVFRHKHPGEEVIYVLEGSLQYDIDGQPPIRVSAGEGLTVPADTVHAATNIGTRNAAELATYIVEKGKPFLVAAE